MKARTILAFFILLLCATWMMAQATNGNSGQSGVGTAAGTPGTGPNTTNSQAAPNNGTAANPATTNAETTSTAAGAQAPAHRRHANANAANGAAANGATGANGNGGTLPKTATPLPIIAGIGVGLIGAGLVTRKRNRRKAHSL